MSTADVLDSNMRLRTEVAKLRAVVAATREILASSRYSDENTRAQVDQGACERARIALDALDEWGGA